MGDDAAAAQEQPIRQFHDVGFVDGMNLFALVLAGVLEGKTRNAGRSLLGNDLDAFNHPGHDFMLDAGVSLSVFSRTMIRSTSG